ncbi:MAG: rhomboid family intramembrane serine protease [Candidatus Aenigmarchaeota archaeon]|nr:rhomboid family intramembrane serine protease [Candidatus Aenigmarchaeota archaeon]
MELHRFKGINATYLLTSICITMFLFEVFFNYIFGKVAFENLFYTYGFSFSNLLAGKWWTFITSIFLHANAQHITLNMIALFFFGSVVEHELGWKKVLLVFFSSAILGNVFVLIATVLGIMPAAVPVLGASGAIFGLLGVAMLVKPLEFIMFPYLVPIPLLLVALIYIFFNITEFVFVLVTGGVTDIAYVAHIGGLAAGILFGFKQEGKEKSIKVLVLILAVLILIPLVWEFIRYLELANYATFISNVFK